MLRLGAFVDMRITCVGPDGPPTTGVETDDHVTQKIPPEVT